MLSYTNVFALVVLGTLTEVIATGSSPGCNADNCLRALDQISTVNAFCSSFLATSGFGPTPSEVAFQCTSASTSISSACSCFVTTSSLPVTTLPPTTTTASTTPPASTVTSSITTPTPCARNVCFSTHFNSQSVPGGDVVWLSAVFKPKFSGALSSVSFTSSHVTFNNVPVTPTPPDSFIQLNPSLQSCSTAQLIGGKWQTTAPLPGSGSTFLSAVSIPVPPGTNFANAQVTWCGDVTAPGEIDVQIAAAVYTSCSMSDANPEACETHTNYHAGVPTGCLNNLVPGGTGGGGSNFSGSLSATYAVCKAS